LRVSQGTVFVFTDADCRFHTDCLAALSATVSQSVHSCFQLCLVGDRSTLVGRAEDLRLGAFQRHALQPDGCIRYLNTAGFAIRRSRVDAERGLFHPLALRGEDTVLLASMIQKGELPFFVPNAILQHVIPLSLAACFRKDVRTAFLEGSSYQRIAASGIKIRISNRERLSLLWSAWKAAGVGVGKAAWFVLVARQLLQRVVTSTYQLVHPEEPASRQPE